MSNNEMDTCPFVPGARVAVFSRSRFSDEFLSEDFVAKVYKNGNFTLRGDAGLRVRYRSSFSHGRGEWRAYRAGDRWVSACVEPWTAATDAKLTEAAARRKHDEAMRRLTEYVNSRRRADVSFGAIREAQRALVHDEPGTLARVRELHKAFGVPVLSRPALPADRAPLMVSLLREEVGEVAEAVERGDLAAVLHELCDLQYVLDATFLEFGLHPCKRAAFAEVHRANMSKLGEDGKPVLRADGKYVKGPNFKPADVAPILAEYLRPAPNTAEA